MNRSMIAAWGLVLNLALCAAAWAQPRLPFAPTDKEILMLPEECKVKLKGGPAASSYAQRLPGVWEHLHHYCFGLNFMNRARYSSLDKTEKRFNLQSAIGELGYVLNHSDPKAKGLQQIQVQKELAEMMLKTL